MVGSGGMEAPQHSGNGTESVLYIHEEATKLLKFQGLYVKHSMVLLEVKTECESIVTKIRETTGLKI